MIHLWLRGLLTSFLPDLSLDLACGSRAGLVAVDAGAQGGREWPGAGHSHFHPAPRPMWCWAGTAGGEQQPWGEGEMGEMWGGDGAGDVAAGPVLEGDCSEGLRPVGNPS